jgi:hypothetical protein
MGMPRISVFYGIAIAMYYAEHGVPHFHALYAGEDASGKARGGLAVGKSGAVVEAHPAAAVG